VELVPAHELRVRRLIVRELRLAILKVRTHLVARALLLLSSWRFIRNGLSGPVAHHADSDIRVDLIAALP
jgi:hypothetical protein